VCCAMAGMPPARRVATSRDWPRRFIVRMAYLRCIAVGSER
jgi:hypothetical protein